MLIVWKYNLKQFPILKKKIEKTLSHLITLATELRKKGIFFITPRFIVGETSLFRFKVALATFGMG